MVIKESFKFSAVFSTSMNRRQFLYLAAATVLGISGCQSVPYEMQIVRKPCTNIYAPRMIDLEQMIGISKMLVEFPDIIPGAQSIEKYLIPNSDLIIVHIRQDHQTEYTTESELERIRKVQYNIATVLFNILPLYGINKVYCEGVTPQNRSFKNLSARLNFYTSFPERKEIINDSRFLGWYPSAELTPEKFKEKAPRLYKLHLEEQTKLEYDAVYYYASRNGTLDIAAAEDVEVQKKANELFNLGRSSLFGQIIAELLGANYYINTKRENIALDMVIEESSPMAVLVYGAGHSFYDNIKKRNQGVSKTLSLIEISPIGLEE